MKIFHARQADPVHFQLNLTKRVLSRRDGKPVEKTLPDQEMRLLCHFVEHPGELLTRAQLQRVGWGARQMASDTVDKAVSEIRAALGDNRTDQFFIRTVRPSRDQPGPRGYRFVAEFEPSPPNDEQREQDEELGYDSGPPPDVNGGAETGTQYQPQPTVVATQYTDGDWITAAIVAPERAETELKIVALNVKAQLKKRVADSQGPPDRRQLQEELIVDFLHSRGAEFMKQYKDGGMSDEARAEACISKVVADLLHTEMVEWEWAVNERPEEEPLLVFRDLIKTFNSRHGKAAWRVSRPPSTALAADALPGEQDQPLSQHSQQPAQQGTTKSEPAENFLKRIDGLIYALTHFHSNPEGVFYIGQTLVECEAFLEDHVALGSDVQTLIDEIVNELDSDERKELGALDPVISVSKVRRLVKHLKTLRQEHLSAERGTS